MEWEYLEWCMRNEVRYLIYKAGVVGGAAHLHLLIRAGYGAQHAIELSED